MKVRSNDYSQSLIKDLLYTSDYLWIAFEGSGGSTTLKKIDYNDLTNEIYSKSISVNDINALDESGNYIYYTVDDDTYILGGALKANPISTDTLVSIPAGITQKPIDFCIGSSNIFVLLPGDTSGTNAKVLRFSYSELTITYQETIDLTAVNDAIKIVQDSSNNLWVITSESPATLVEVYEESGAYTYDTYTISDIDIATDMVIDDDYLYVSTDTNPATVSKIDTISSAVPQNTTENISGSAMTATNAKSIAYNSTFDKIYLGCEDGKVVKVDNSDLTNQEELEAESGSGANNISEIDVDSNRKVTYAGTDDSTGEVIRLDEGENNFVSLKVPFLLQTLSKIKTKLSTIFSKTISVKFSFLIQTKNSLSCKLCFKKSASPTPLSRTDFHVYIDGVEINDLDLSSILVRKSESNYPEASFTLARVHDNPNKTLDGTTSQITNNNTVTIYVDTTKVFEGTISNLAFDAEEQIRVRARGDSESERSFKTVELPYPSKDSHLDLYEIINHNIETRYKRTTGRDPETYLGIKASLGTLKSDKWVIDFIGATNTSELADNIMHGDFQPEPNYTYFWEFSGTNIWTNDSFSNKYVGTSSSSITDDTWNITSADYVRQIYGGTREYTSEVYEVIKDASEQSVYEGSQADCNSWVALQDTPSDYTVQFKENGDEYYYLGSAPYREVSPTNGAELYNTHYEDRDDGMYVIREDGHDHRQYVREVAGKEYDKLKNIGGEVNNKVTTANIDITVDAFLFYGLKTNTRINIGNTTESGVFNNNSDTGFPVSVKSINIDSGTMQVNLQCDNQLSEYELEELDNEKPKEGDDRFYYPGIDSFYKSKYNPDSLSDVQSLFEDDE